MSSGHCQFFRYYDFSAEGSDQLESGMGNRNNVACVNPGFAGYNALSLCWLFRFLSLEGLPKVNGPGRWRTRSIYATHLALWSIFHWSWERRAVSVPIPAACPPSPESTRTSGQNRASKREREGTGLLPPPRGTLLQPELGLSQHVGKMFCSPSLLGFLLGAGHPSIGHLGQRSQGRHGRCKPG